jgi:hypothetical protein
LPQVKGPRAFECFEQLDARGLTQFR